MAVCPNKSLESWKMLVASRGEAMAYFLWDKYNGEVPESESNSEIVKASLKVVDRLLQLSSIKEDKRTRKYGELNEPERLTIRLNTKSHPYREINLRKTLQNKGVTNQQIDFIFDYMKSNNIQEISTEQLALEIASNYSYNVEINTAKDNIDLSKGRLKVLGNYIKLKDGWYIDGGGRVSDELQIELENRYNEINFKEENTKYYANMTVPGGINYTENEISTPSVTPAIKGHAQFSTDNGIGWFRSDDKVSEGTIEEYQEEVDGELVDRYITLGEKSEIRRILEVQSDLFQKGRDKKNLTFTPELSEFKEGSVVETSKGKFEILGTEYNVENNTYYKKLKNLETGQIGSVSRENFLKSLKLDTQNQFLQLLNKDNNWVTFFIKSIIQDSAKKGYKKVLFPTGNTASKIEGHITLEEFKKQKEVRIKDLEKENKKLELEIQEKGFINSELERQVFSDNEYEIKIVKEELERVEKEGFGALRPIFNFYETTVTNILKKQGYSPVTITDEFGNSWNEVVLSEERDNATILFQTENSQMSKASDDTINKVKKAAEQMGIRIQELTEYAKSNPNVDVTNVNGVADLVKGVIAVSQGRENVALTEEMVHIATAIIEQVNPKLITDLISKIDRFAIFGRTLQEYKGKKAYQLSNGKPDIRKIKKEAVDKLIAELIINNSEGSTEFPELMSKENRTLVQKMWDAIVDFFRGMYKKTDIDLFKSTAEQIISGNVGGNVNDISSTEVFYQINQNTAVDKIYDFIKNIDSRMDIKNADDPETRHYTLDGKELGDSVTKRLKAKSKKVFNRTPEQQIVDDQKREWGSVGHKFIEDYINKVLIDKNGYKLEKKNDDVILNTSLNPETQVAIMTFANELIDSYPAGTRFMSEVKVVNEKVKGGMPSTLDFVAIEPVTSPTGEQDYKIDVLDWKFTSLDASITDDIPWFKQKEWKEQMGEYTKILYNYGVERKNVRKTRMLPFIVNYEYLVPGDKLTPLVAKSVEIGKLDSLTETKMYLLPVPTNTETTGNAKIDSLLKSLRIYWEKMYKLQVSPEQKADKDLMMNQISNAIRKLQMNLNFEPLIGVAETFMKNVKVTLEDLEKTNISDLSEEQLKIYLGELLSFQKSAEKFINIDDVYLSNISQDNMTDKEASLFKRLRNVSGATKTMLSKISDIQKEVAVNLGLKENITTEQSKLTVLEAEREIGGLDKSFLESSKLSSKIIQVATSMIIKAKSILNIQYSRMADEFEKIILPLEQEAKAKGVDAFNLIGRTTDKGLKLINKIDSEFLKEIKQAKKDKNKEFLLKNLDLEGYVEAVSKVIDASTATIKRTHFSDNEEENEAKQTAAIIKLSRSLDIQRKDFDGYDDYQFNYFYRQFMNEEDHLSNEYKNMSENALKVWEYFTNLNKEGKKLGYLDRQGMTFFPMIEATTIQKVMQSGNILGESKDFFKDMYSIIPDEEIGFAKIDEETGELKKEVPKFFLRTNKQTEQLSKDLKRVGLLWTKSLMEYKNARNLEDTLLTLHSVEKVKGSLIVDTSGNVVFDGSHPSINEKENRNADVLMTIINDSIYGITEDLSSLGNRVLSTTVSKVSGNVDTIEERTMSTKKALKTGDTLVRALALGLKPLVGIANWFGTQMQAYVNSGGMYTNLEFQKNNLKVMNPLGLRLEEKALIDLIVPLSGEDVVTQKLRNISLKNSIPSYLSTWSFTDVMMITNSFGERKLELANALSILDNSMIIDNKIVNIRQYLREQDRQKRKDLTEAQRKELEKSFETRVNDLKEKQSLTKVAKVIDGKLSLGEEVSDLELAKLRIKIIEFGRNLNGQMSNDDKMGYRRDTIFSSFMMFKGWIPKQISVRAIDLRKNTSLDEWEYGRARAFINTIQHVGLKSSKDLFDIIAGTDKGLAIINQMLIEKKHNYYLKTGKVLEITEEEFQDLIRTQIKNQLKELAVLVGTTALLLAAKAAEPPEEASDLEKNRYKYWAKLTNKMYDEISFYYNPASADEMTRGSILPSLGLISKVLSFFKALGKEGYYYVIDDEKSQDKTYPTKYFINLIPVAAQLQNEVLPLVDPELAREMGVRVTSQSRRQ